MVRGVVARRGVRGAGVGIIAAVAAAVGAAPARVASLRRTVKGAAARLAALGPDGPPLTAQLRAALEGGRVALRAPPANGRRQREGGVVEASFLRVVVERRRLMAGGWSARARMSGPLVAYAVGFEAELAGWGTRGDRWRISCG